MEFKPTILKLLTTLAAGIVSFWLSFKLLAEPGECVPDQSNIGTQVCADFFATPTIPIIISVGVIAALYLIWSLSTKSEKS